MSNLVQFNKYFKKKPQKTLQIEKTIYASKGEVITCTNGHEIAEFLVDVYLGDIQDVEVQVGNWRQDKVPVGAPAENCVCKQCGALFYVWGLHHIGDAWRDPLKQLSSGIDGIPID